MKQPPARIATAAFIIGRLFAQNVPKPSFEVVSIRPGSHIATQCPGGGLRAVGVICGGPGTSDPGRFTGNGAPLRSLIQRAVGVQPLQLFGPDWIASARYDIAAVIPAGATQEELKLMLQGMLEDRFKLKSHRETREFAAYNLVLAKGGLKLRETMATDACAIGARPAGKACPQGVEYANGIAESSSDRGTILTAPPRDGGGGIQTGLGVTLADLAKSLQVTLRGSVVIDKTGLDGRYDFRYQFSPVDVGAAGEFSAPSLFTAIEKDLGLKLEPTKTKLDCIVIDHIEPPSEN